MAQNNNIVFIDTSKECIQMMAKMSKDALKASGKIITDTLKEKVNVAEISKDYNDSNRL